MDKFSSIELGHKMSEIIDELRKKTDEGILTWAQSMPQTLIKPCVDNGKSFYCEYRDLRIEISIDLNNFAKSLTLTKENKIILNYIAACESNYHRCIMNNQILSVADIDKLAKSFGGLAVTVQKSADKDSVAYFLNLIHRSLSQ